MCIILLRHCMSRNDRWLFANKPRFMIHQKPSLLFCGWQILLSVWSSVLLITKTVPVDKDINVWLIFWYHTAFGNAWLYYFMVFKRNSYCLLSVTMGNIYPIPFWGSFERTGPCSISEHWHWDSAGSWNPSLGKTRTLLSCKINTWLLMTWRRKEPRHQKP